MSGAKETPRQKMIGMMYLVLTALLALNVSKEILNAFIAIEESLNTTNVNFDGKNQILYSKFDKALADNKGKAQKYFDNAQKAKKWSKELCDSINAVKARLYQAVQGVTKEQSDTFQLKYLDSKDNYDIPTRILIGADPETPTGSAIGLKKQIEEFKKNMANLIDNPTEKAGLKLGLDTKDTYSVAEEKTVTWEDNNFYHAPIAAVLSIMAKLKTDVKNAEGDVVQTLLKSVTANDYSFDAVEAKVVAESNYITAGEEYRADIFVSAHNSAQDPQVLVGKVDTTDRKHPKVIGTGENVPVSGGVGRYIVKTSAQGDQNYDGVINVKGPTGEIKAYPFHAEYKVAAPSFAVSPSKMNVFYIGVPNPVDISVAGSAPNDITASITGATGSIKPLGQGKFEVTLSAGTECDVNLSVKTKSGSKSAGKQHFRVKKVPSPNASFAGVTGDGPVSTAELSTAGGVIPKSDAFEFDLKFPVVSWNMSMMVNGLYIDAPATGPGVTSEQKAMLAKAKKGGRVLIENVYVMAPEGKRHIAGCVLKVK